MVASRIGWPVSVDSSWASASPAASIASASRSSSRPRSAAASPLQAGKAARAASTARSTSAALASATRASREPSCGLVTSKVAPSAPSVNSPPMNSLSWTRTRLPSGEVVTVAGSPGRGGRPSLRRAKHLLRSPVRNLTGKALVADPGYGQNFW